MAKFCPLCNKMTNCTDNCASCLEEEEVKAASINDEFHEELIIEQQEQM